MSKEFWLTFFRYTMFCFASVAITIAVLTHLNILSHWNSGVAHPSKYVYSVVMVSTYAAIIFLYHGFRSYE
ncbi:hypothetical protein LCGC14_1126470 [marine sediment metagenome]|uniref:Uncharacterized protein n=1 Tax=marine sediment metagenome TaxID=412755 RepID=A0A0F9M766_9ZZZZ